VHSFHKKNLFNAIAWSYSVASIDQINYSFFGFDIPSNIDFKSHLNEKILLDVKRPDLRKESINFIRGLEICRVGEVFLSHNTSQHLRAFLVTKTRLTEKVTVRDIKFTSLNCAICFNNIPSHFVINNFIGSLIKTPNVIGFQSPWKHYPFLPNSVDFLISKTDHST